MKKAGASELKGALTAAWAFHGDTWTSRSKCIRITWLAFVCKLVQTRRPNANVRLRWFVFRFVTSARSQWDAFTEINGIFFLGKCTDTHDENISLFFFFYIKEAEWMQLIGRAGGMSLFAVLNLTTWWRWIRNHTQWKGNYSLVRPPVSPKNWPLVWPPIRGITVQRRVRHYC